MTRPARPLPQALPAALARALALVAMLLQVVFLAEHLGASAAHDPGRAGAAERLGFLQICTGEGVALFDPASGRVVPGPGGADHGGCAICASASICSFATPGAAVTAAPQPLLLAAVEPVAVLPLGVIAPLSRSGLIRAPPGV